MLCVWLGFKVNSRPPAALDIAQAILQAGGRVAYDYQMVPVPVAPDDFNINDAAMPQTPAWLRSIFGDDFFCNVIYVGFSISVVYFKLCKLPTCPQSDGLSCGQSLPPRAVVKLKCTFGMRILQFSDS